MSDPFECKEYTEYRSDRSICPHGSIRRNCSACESDVQDLMIERLSAEVSALRKAAAKPLYCPICGSSQDYPYEPTDGSAEVERGGDE